jgi:hypothetical protein
MKEELELHLSELRSGLDAEVDLFGSRTQMAYHYRQQIIQIEKELSDYGCCDHCGEPYLLGGDDHNGETGNHYECEETEN